MNKNLPHIPSASKNQRINSRRKFAGVFVGCAFIFLFAFGAEARSWEYRVVNAGLNNRPLETLLNSLGAENWELVQITTKGVAIFKRQKR